jgi:hypothetical protein
MARTHDECTYPPNYRRYEITTTIDTVRKKARRLSCVFQAGSEGTESRIRYRQTRVTFSNLN